LPRGEEAEGGGERALFRVEGKAVGFGAGSYTPSSSSKCAWKLFCSAFVRLRKIGTGN
jgi:hypothetical protein